MKRVVMISEHASPLAMLGGVDAGGQNVYVGQLARHLANAGYEVDVFTRRDDPALPEVVPWGGARVIHVPAGPPARVRKEELLPFMRQFTDFMVRFCRGLGCYDLIHANFFMSALVAADLKRALGTPFVVTFHALGRVRRLHQKEADAFPEERLAIEDRVVAEADRVLAECPQDRDDLVHLYHANPERLPMAPCGFDPEEFGPRDRQEARAELGLGPDAWTVLQLGRMVPRKGVDNVIRAVGRLRAAYDVPARLVIVGGETREPDPRATPEIGRLQALAEAEGVRNAVTFVGSRGRKELRDYYAASDVFVTTPWYEPFGITPIEAMACGRPVVGAAVGGIKFTVRDGQTGFLVPPKDPDALAVRLVQLYHDADLRERMGEAALRRANTLFTWERVARQVAKVYEDVLTPARERRWARRLSSSTRTAP
jgi:glycosyltransferase involved in cell wall biosynthesis